MSTFLLLIATILFAIATFDGKLGGLNLTTLGLTFFAASFLVGPVVQLVRRSPPQ